MEILKLRVLVTEIEQLENELLLAEQAVPPLETVFYMFKRLPYPVEIEVEVIPAIIKQLKLAKELNQEYTLCEFKTT